jgi:hypothetical protein
MDWYLWIGFCIGAGAAVVTYGPLRCPAVWYDPIVWLLIGVFWPITLLMLWAHWRVKNLPTPPRDEDWD